MKATNDNRVRNKQREPELRKIALFVAAEMPGLAPFEYEWAVYKPLGLPPEELSWVEKNTRMLSSVFQRFGM